MHNPKLCGPWAEALTHHCMLYASLGWPAVNRKAQPLADAFWKVCLTAHQHHNNNDQINSTWKDKLKMTELFPFFVCKSFIKDWWLASIPCSAFGMDFLVRLFGSNCFTSPQCALYCNVFAYLVSVETICDTVLTVATRLQNSQTKMEICKITMTRYWMIIYPKQQNAFRS